MVTVRQTLFILVNVGFNSFVLQKYKKGFLYIMANGQGLTQTGAGGAAAAGTLDLPS